MRDIRTRIAQRSGIELSNQQIQELAARRLEAILDPRGLKPELLEQLRRTAGERSASTDTVTPSSTQSYPFDEAALYDSPNALLRFIRKLLQPLLRMMFNPTPIAHALAVQSRLNAEIAARETERDRRQAEWNALHYEILQRLALEVSRGSIDTQNLLLRVESLAAKVDFNERRVRSMEGAQVRGRPQETVQPAQAVSVPASESVATPPQAGSAPPTEPSRRRRRRRRGRRGPGANVPGETGATASHPGSVAAEPEDTDIDEGFEDEAASEPINAMEPAGISGPITSSSRPLAPSDQITTSDPVGPSEPVTASEPIPPTASVAPPEPVDQFERIGAGPSRVPHEEPVSPAEPEHYDESPPRRAPEE